MSGNIVNGRPLLFLKGHEKEVLDKVVDYGQIIISGCSDIVIENSILSVPIMVGYSTGVIVSNNTITGATFGLILMGIEDSYVFDNVITGYGPKPGEGVGIDIRDSYSSVLENNLVTDSDEGISVSKSQHITIKLNEIRNCSMGIELGNTEYIDVINNTIDASGYSGISIWGYSSLSWSVHAASMESSINILWNDFVNNDISGIDNGVSAANYAYNYWSDYEGEDLDGDGFGETPYHLEGSSGATDNHPRMFLLSEGPPESTETTTTTTTTGQNGSDQGELSGISDLIVPVTILGVVSIIAVAAVVLKRGGN